MSAPVEPPVMLPNLPRLFNVDTIVTVMGTDDEPLAVGRLAGYSVVSEGGEPRLIALVELHEHYRGYVENRKFFIRYLAVSPAYLGKYPVQ